MNPGVFVALKFSCCKQKNSRWLRKHSLRLTNEIWRSNKFRRGRMLNYRTNVTSPFLTSRLPSLNLAIILYAKTAGFNVTPSRFPSQEFVGSSGRKFLAANTKFPHRSNISIDSISLTSDAALINNRSLIPSPFGEKTFGM